MKFIISAKSTPVEYDGNAVIFTTGKAPYTNHTDILFSRELKKGVFTYKTGLSPKDIENNDVLTDNDKNIFLEKQKVLLDIIHTEYNEEVLDPNNHLFWNDQRTTFKINDETLQTIFDTNDPDDAILYLNIISGGFSSIAPSEIYTEMYSFYKYFITTQEEEDERGIKDQYGSKVEAYSELMDLLTEAGNDALVYISYLLNDINKGWTKNTSRATLKTNFIRYIEEGNSGKDKKKAVDNFYKLALLWKSDKETLIAKANISAAIYFGVIRKTRDKMFVYKDIQLGKTEAAIFNFLMKAANATEFDEILEKTEIYLTK